MKPVNSPLEQQIGNLLISRGLSLATAESCTGGLVAHHLTNVAGSSAYFYGGIVAYTYEAKVSLLNASWNTLREFGAVSRETVIEMARGGRQALSADIAVSVSGIAGPGGGIPDKPVGTTWVGFSANEGDWARRFVWNGNREENKAQSAQAALQMVLDYLQNKISDQP